MLSKNGKEEYVCCHCHNPDIQKIRMYGQNSFECRSCNRWYAWGNKKTIKAGEKLMLREDYMFTVGIGIGMLLGALAFIVVFSFTEDRVKLLSWTCGTIFAVSVAAMIWVNLKFRGIV